MNRYAVIMAGGAGSRLWPLSRESKPKQFIGVGGDKSMLLQTIERLLNVVSPEHCFIITSRHLYEITKEAVDGLIPLQNIILEPVRRNTAACIAYATMEIYRRYGSGLLCCIPADGYIKDLSNYTKALKLAYDAAEDTGCLTIIGIRPTYASTGYGYIDVEKNPKKQPPKVYGFTEKPDEKTARKMLESGNFLWNSGILVGDMDVIVSSIKKYLPNHYEKLYPCFSLMESPSAECIEKSYAQLSDVSFDIGVLEKCDSLYAVKGDFDWDDVGSLDALANTIPVDENANAVTGQHVSMNTHHSLIYSEGVLVATIDIDNMLIVCTKDAVLVCPRDKAQEVKSFVEKLKSGEFFKYV